MTSIGAGAALVAAGLSMGVGVPANAAEDNLRGSVMDPEGNPATGVLNVYTSDGDFVSDEYVANGRIESTIPETGDFKLQFQSYENRLQSEYYLDKTTLTDATVVAGSAGVVQLSPWTIDFRPFVSGVVTDQFGAAISYAQVQVFDAVTGDYEGGAQADQDGVFEAPATGTEPVKVFVSDNYNDFASEWFNDKPTQETAEAVTPTTAGTALGNIVLTKGASISGVVTSDAGVPLELVRVEAYDPDTGSYSQDYTNPSGVYTLEGLRAGSFVLEASDETLDEYAGEYYNNVQDPAAATLIPAAKDQAVTGINMSLTPLEVEPVTGADISGTVVDETGKPVVGTSVTALTTPTDYDDVSNLEYTVTNRQGGYVFTEIDGVPDDAVKVYANGHPLREEDGYSVDGAYFGNTYSWDAATPIATNTLPRSGANIQLVTAGGITGKVTSDTGAPLKGGYVVAYDKDGDRLTGNQSSGLSFVAMLDQYPGYATVKGDGTYKMNTLPPGDYTVAFYAAEHIGEFWKDTVRGHATAVTIVSGKSVTGIDAVLTKSLVAVDRPTITGEPLVGATLTADSGVWNLMSKASYTYEWLADGVVVGTGPSLTLAGAQFGKTIAVRVSSKVETFEKVLQGQAVSASTTAVQAGTATTAKAKKGKVKVGVTAGAVGASLVDGKVVVKLQVTKKKLVKITAGKVVNGQAKLKIKKILGSKKLAKQLKKLSPKKAKKATLVFVFSGTNFIGSQDKVAMKKLVKAAKKGKKGKGKKGKN